MIRSLISVFQMYSRIPMPKVEWKEENRRYSLCFFPLIGAVIGGLVLLWSFICEQLDMGRLMYAAGVLGIDILVTGGIHLDGFCDTCDARASWRDKARKLEILRDSHIGAFAAIKLGVYLIVYTAFLTELTGSRAAEVTALTFVLSRCLSGLAAISFKSAKHEGTLHSFASPAHKKVTAAVLISAAAVCCGAMILLHPAMGGAAAAAALASMAWYRIMSYREFDGITGDLAGWFLQVCQLSAAAAAAIACRITEVM